MPALTQDRRTSFRDGISISDPIAAGVTLYVGGMYTLDAAGNAKPSAAADTKPVRGVTQVRAEAADGDPLVKGARGCYRFANSAAAAAVTRAEIGQNAFVADDQTVSKTGTSIAGEVIDIDEVGVWVAVGSPAAS